MKRIWIVLGAATFAVLVALMLVDLRLADGALRAASSEEQHGYARVRVGDRQLSVRFSEDFPTAPVLHVSARTPGGPSAIVRDATSNGFVIELDRRADTDIHFYWTANWSRGDWSHFDVSKPPKLEPLFIEINNDNVPVRLTGATLYVPTEFWIDKANLGSADITPQRLKASVLEAAEQVRREELSCSFRQRLKRLVRMRARDCPPREVYNTLPDWDPRSEEWVIVEEPAGFRIVQQGHHDTESEYDFVRQSLAALLRTASAFDVMPHNNQVVDFLDVLLEDGVISGDQSLTFIHFDTHSDLSVFKDHRGFLTPEKIGDFLNILISRGLVEEVYWVMPDWTKSPSYEPEFFDPSVVEFAESNYSRGHYEEGPTQLDIFVDTSNGNTYMESPPDHVDQSKLKRVRYHKITLDELPDFSMNSQVYLELDADYFSNSGFQTKLSGGDNPSSTDLANLLIRMENKLRQSGVKPILASICLSPEFTTTEDRAYMHRVFLDAAGDAGLADYLQGYHHNISTGKVGAAENVRRSGPVGQLMLELVKLDARDSNADERISVDPHDSEYQRAEATFMEMLGVDRYTAETTIMKMDRFDGQLNGSLDLVEFEYYTALENPGWVLPDNNYLDPDCGPRESQKCHSLALTKRTAK